MKGSEHIETARLVFAETDRGGCRGRLHAVFWRHRSYQVYRLAQTSVHRANQSISSLQRSRMESMACRSLLDRTSGQLAGLGWLSKHQQSPLLGTYSRDAWGHGYATEALAAIVVVARDLGVQRLYALCHPNHPASVHVLEKCGFVLEDRVAGFADFPNLGFGQREDCLRYVSWQLIAAP
jgi:RimJ/RimL family protein N-acetyltransferase